MSTSLRLDVVTPDKQVVSETVDYVSCPGVEGEFGVLVNHVSLLSALKIGTLRYDTGDKKQYVFVSGGFADVNNNVMTVLAESAELAQDIDQSRALASKERAEKRLTTREESVDVIRAEAALQRAIARLNIAGMA